MNDQIIHSERRVKIAAKQHKVAVNQICVICLEVIELMTFKNTGVCCESHRKIRDNDLQPFRGGHLAP